MSKSFFERIGFNPFTLWKNADESEIEESKGIWSSLLQLTMTHQFIQVRLVLHVVGAKLVCACALF